MAKKSKKSNQPKKQPEPQKSEYSRAGLIRLTRSELNEVALSFNINGKRVANKELLADQIMLEVLNGDDATVDGITPKNEIFCQLYASDREFFGNGTQSYIEAYDIDLSTKGAYKSAQAAASRLLSNVIILKRIHDIMEHAVLNDEYVDKKMGFWIMQEANPMASIAAIKEYNKVKKRVDAHPLMPNLTQNNYTVNITDERGQFLSKKYQGFMEHVTKREATEEEDKARRAVPAHIVAQMTRSE